MTISLFGCRKPKYRLLFDGNGFETRKTLYAEGETVKVYFRMIATDTDYHFWLDDEDIKLNRDYDDRHGYIFTFTMPDHDVTLHKESHNSMVYQPVYAITIVNEVADADIWVLPETEENLNTTVWGTATVAKLGKGNTREFGLRDTFVSDLWMIRIIDDGHALYSAGGLVLSEGYRIVFRTEGTKADSVIEVLDAEGTVLYSEPAFTGVLGGK